MADLFFVARFKDGVHFLDPRRSWRFATSNAGAATRFSTCAGGVTEASGAAHRIATRWPGVRRCGRPGSVTSRPALVDAHTPRASRPTERK